MMSFSCLLVDLTNSKSYATFSICVECFHFYRFQLSLQLQTLVSQMFLESFSFLLGSVLVFLIFIRKNHINPPDSITEVVSLVGWFGLEIEQRFRFR